jgi:N-acetylneuraminic acid mutarotase
VPFKPSGTYAHTATFINNKLYILGGAFTSNSTLKREFFYLDTSVPFDTNQELSWRDLTKFNMVPLHGSATSAKGGANNDTLFLYGGFSNNTTTEIELTSGYYTYDPQHIVWNRQEITGINTVRQYELTGIINYDGKFYLWSGSTGVNVFANEFLILDTINLNWSKGSLVNAPTPRCNYGATLLPNNKIIYIGKRVIISFIHMFC